MADEENTREAEAFIACMHEYAQSMRREEVLQQMRMQALECIFDVIEARGGDLNASDVDTVCKHISAATTIDAIRDAGQAFMSRLHASHAADAG